MSAPIKKHSFNIFADCCHGVRVNRPILNAYVSFVQTHITSLGLFLLCMSPC